MFQKKSVNRQERRPLYLPEVHVVSKNLQSVQLKSEP